VTRHIPKLVVLSVALVTLVPSRAQTPITDKRDQALRRIRACLRRNEVSSRECKYLNEDVETLVGIYRNGDKTVLSTLFQFTYLTDFYDEALFSDPDGFLTAMAQLSPEQQQAVAAGIAGGPNFSIGVGRFNAIRRLLTDVPDASPTKGVANVSLKIVETTNAALFVNYFPPGTFASRAADFQVAWYSSDMYELGEKPLWQPSAENQNTFRFTYLAAFTGPKAVTLDVLPDGSGKVELTTIANPTRQKTAHQPSVVPEALVSHFLQDLGRAQFWEMPAESPQRGFDGAEWILEAVRDGKYHVVVRWCPGLYEHSAEDAAFADAARFLFRLAGFKHKGGC
jgi:hypothetical protein